MLQDAHLGRHRATRERRGLRRRPPCSSSRPSKGLGRSRATTPRRRAAASPLAAEAAFRVGPGAPAVADERDQQAHLAVGRRHRHHRRGAWQQTVDGALAAVNENGRAPHHDGAAGIGLLERVHPAGARRARGRRRRARRRGTRRSTVDLSRRAATRDQRTFRPRCGRSAAGLPDDPGARPTAQGNGQP